MRKNFVIGLIVVFLSTLIITSPVMAKDTSLEGSIAEPAADGAKPWSVGSHCSNRSAFKLFGSVASDDPVCGLSLSFEEKGWGITAHGTEEVGEHEAGVIGPYWGLIGTKEWVNGKFTVTGGLEVFDSPSYKGGQAFTFISPFGSVGYDFTPNLGLTVGGAYLGTHNTDWQGERTYGYFDLSYSRSVGRWTPGLAGGFVASNSGRETLYVEPSLEYAFRDLVISGSALWADTEEHDVESTVPWTVTIGASYDF